MQTFPQHTSTIFMVVISPSFFTRLGTDVNRRLLAAILRLSQLKQEHLVKMSVFTELPVNFTGDVKAF